MSRSGELVKVRGRGPTSQQASFGQLVRRYMILRGYGNQEVAIRAYNDEERISSVSDVLAGRYHPKADTIVRFRDALDIPQTEIEQIFSSKLDQSSLEKIEADIASLARSREADQRTIDTLSDVIQALKSQLPAQGLTSEAIERMLKEFLGEIGAGASDPILWPATLRSVANELRQLRTSLGHSSNEPSSINASRAEAAKAIDVGDYATAERELEKVLDWTDKAYRENRNDFLNAASDHAKALASLGSIAFAQFDYARARECYLRIVKLEGVPIERIDGYKRSLRVAFTALAARSNDFQEAGAIFEEMKRAGVTPNEFTYTTLINLAPDYTVGRAVFEEMKQAGVTPNEVTYTALINLAPDYTAGRAVFEEMKQADVTPNEITYTTLINLAPDYKAGRAVFEEMKQADLTPNEITYTTLIKLAPDYKAGRAIFEEMVKAGVTPDEVANCTLINLTKNYHDARAAIDEIRHIRGINPGEGQLTTVLSKIDTFEEALEVALDFRKLKYFTGRSLYEAVFGKPIIKYNAKELLGIYHSLPFKFETSLQGPLRQFRAAGQLDDVVILCIAAPHVEAAKSFYKEEYAFCKTTFEAEIASGSDEDNLFYAYGIAATLNKDWTAARANLSIALTRASHEKRTADINRHLRVLPPE